MGLGLGLSASSSSYTSEYLPTEISNLLIWLSTDTLNTLDTVDSNTGEVQSWTNRAATASGGLGGEFKAIDANRGPIANNTRTEITFSGTTNGDSLELKDENLNTIDAELEIQEGYTICMIVTNEGMDSGSTFAGSSLNSPSRLTFFDTDVIQMRTHGGLTTNLAAEGINDDVFFSLIIVVEDGQSDNCRTFINNTETATDTIDENFRFGQLGGNGGNSLNVSPTKMKQVLVYGKALNEAERNALYTNYIAPAI